MSVRIGPRTQLHAAQRAALYTRAQRRRSEHGARGTRGRADGGAEIGAERGEPRERTAEEPRERQSVDEGGGEQQVAVRNGDDDAVADGERPLRCERHALGARHAPRAQPGAAFTARSRELDFDALRAGARDGARGRRTGLIGNEVYSATRDDAIVRTVWRGTSPTAVTLRPRSMSENALVLPIFENPSETSDFVCGSSMKTDTVASPSE
jgi:hypothetical protein